MPVVQPVVASLVSDMAVCESACVCVCVCVCVCACAERERERERERWGGGGGAEGGRGGGRKLWICLVTTPTFGARDPHVLSAFSERTSRFDTRSPSQHLTRDFTDDMHAFHPFFA